jgi:hypothetical protein
MTLRRLASLALFLALAFAPSAALAQYVPPNTAKAAPVILVDPTGAVYAATGGSVTCSACATAAKQDTGNTSAATTATNTGTIATNTGTVATNTGTIATNTGNTATSASSIDTKLSSQATAANQTSAQANAGSDATKAVAVQGITGAKAVGISAASGTIVDGANATAGALADAACGTDNGTCSLQALIKRLNQRLTTLNTTLGSPQQAGGAVAQTAVAPSTASSAAEACHVYKASAGTIYSLSGYAGVAGWIMVFNLTAAPSDGAVTPVAWNYIAAAGAWSISYGVTPATMSTGVVACLSSTGPLTKTAASTNTVFAGQVQ